MKTIKVDSKVLELMTIKSEKAENLTREETPFLMSWCDQQRESLWDELSLQEILNIYRVSGKWVDWECWFSDEPELAINGWNSAVKREHQMKIGE